MKKGKSKKGNRVCRKNKESTRGRQGSTKEDAGGNEEICRQK